MPTTPTNRSAPMLRKRLIILAITSAITTLLWVTPYMLMARAESRYTYTSPSAVPSRPVGIVFGALVSRSGHLSPVLRGRVDAGVELYKMGKVEKLLMTGDNGSNHYDEVTPMKNYAIARGVPATKIVRDFAGFRTYDSCYRAKHVFAVDRAILVTQAFHMPRALYLAHEVGLDAVGFIAHDNTSANDTASSQRREASAVCKALLDIDVLHKKPKFGGRVEPVIGRDTPDR